MSPDQRDLLLVLALAALLFLIPHLARHITADAVMMGEEPYYHARMAQEIVQKHALPDEPGYRFNPYHLVLAGIGSLIGIEVASVLVPSLLGVLSVLLFYLILGDIGIKQDEKLAICLVLVTSPGILYLAVFSNVYITPIFLTLLGIYLLLRPRNLFKMLSLIPLSLSVFFHPFNAALVISIVAAMFIKARSRISLLILAIVLIIAGGSLYVTFHPVPSLMPQPPLLQDIISDFGALAGVGVFHLLLGLVGFIWIWKSKRENLFLVAPVLVLIISVWLLHFPILYVNFFIAFLAGYAFIRILRMPWSLPAVRNLTLILVFCGLLFSSLSYINRITALQPDREVITSLAWLKQYALPGETVLSHSSRGFWIESIAQQPVMMDAQFPSLPDAAVRLNDSQEIFSSRKLSTTRELLKKYDIHYLWIDAAMKHGLVWQNEGEGLLFLLRNNETFKNVYNTLGIEIWQVMVD